MTKLQMKSLFWERVEKEYTSIHEDVYKLYEQKRVTYGFYLVYGLYDNYHYESMLNKSLDRMTKWEIQYHLDELEKDMKKTKELVEYNKNCTFEDSQMQQCIKNGTIIDINK